MDYSLDRNDTNDEQTCTLSGISWKTKVLSNAERLIRFFAVHMLLELSTFLILQAFVIFFGSVNVKEMVALIILTKWP